MEERERSNDTEQVDVSDTTAPSIGPNTVIDKEPPEERLAGHEQSDTDALGLDKRRQVVGQRYSASAGRQAAIYGIVIAVALGAAFGLKLLVDDLDKAPAHAAEKAPWSGTHREPKPLQ